MADLAGYQQARMAKPYFTLENGQIFNQGVPISVEGAQAVLQRGQEKAAANAKQLEDADPILATIMQRAAALAAQDFALDQQELGPILEQLKATSPAK